MTLECGEVEKKSACHGSAVHSQYKSLQGSWRAKEWVLMVVVVIASVGLISPPAKSKSREANSTDFSVDLIISEPFLYGAVYSCGGCLLFVNA